MIPLNLENDSLDLEKSFNENKYPVMRIVYEGDSIRSKALRSMWIFEKLAFSAEKYDIPIQIEVKKGESEIMTVIVAGGVIVANRILSNFGDDLYKFMKEKILQQLSGEYKSKIKVETNRAWKNTGLPPINSDEITEENDEENKDGRLHS